MSINLSIDDFVRCPDREVIRTMIGQLLTAAMLLVLGSTGALANPDVWVKVGMIYRFENSKVTGITYEWQFDEFFSSRTIGSFDADNDGELEPAEIDLLRAGAFDPLADYGYFVHVWEGGTKRGDPEIEEFTARADDGHLIYRFTVALDPPIDPGAGDVVASLHDESIFVDFEFREEGFLLVQGAMDPGCKFRIARGKGAQSGHRQPVTLNCGG